VTPLLFPFPFPVPVPVLDVEERSLPHQAQIQDQE
jgi:hypothetical protein